MNPLLQKALDKEDLPLEKKIPFVLTILNKLDHSQRTFNITQIIKFIFENEYSMDVSNRLLLGFRIHFPKILPFENPDAATALTPSVIFVLILLTNIDPAQELKFFIQRNSKDILGCFYIQMYESFLTLKVLKENEASMSTGTEDQKTQYALMAKNSAGEQNNFSEKRFYSDLLLQIEIAEYQILQKVLPHDVDFLTILARLIVMIKHPMGIDRSYFGRQKVMLENLVKSDQQKSRDLVQFCLDHLRFSDQLVDTPLLGLFNFGIGVQIQFSCLDGVEEREVVNILVSLKPLDKDVQKIYDGIEKFYKQDNATNVPLIAGILDYLSTHKPHLHKFYLLKVVKWLKQDWSYYPAIDLRLKILSRLFCNDSDQNFYNNIMELLKNLIDSLDDLIYQKLENFEFHTAVCALYVVYLQIYNETMQSHGMNSAENKLLDLREIVHLFKLDPKLVRKYFFYFTEVSRKNSYSGEKKGLANQGNTCYMNSFLQVLHNTEQFKRNLLICDQTGSLGYSNSVFHLQYQFSLLIFSKRSFIMPKLLKNFLPEPFKSGFAQQDVSEFARFYIDDQERDLGLVNRKDLIKEIFVGKVRRTTVCQNNHYNITYEEYYDLMLNPLSNGPCQSASGKISGLVKNFSEPEGLDDYFCSICNAKFPAKLQNEIFSQPSHLILTINSFQFDKATFMKTKTLHGTLLEEYLNQTECQYPTNEKKRYILYGIVIHRGPSPNSGHYYSLIRNPEEQDFYIYDDSSVRCLGRFKAVLDFFKSRPSDTYYMLFYYEDGFYESKEKTNEGHRESQLTKLFDTTELSVWSRDTGGLTQNDDSSMLEEEFSRKLSLSNVQPEVSVGDKFMKLVDIDNKKFEKDKEDQRVLENLNVTRMGRSGFGDRNPEPDQDPDVGGGFGEGFGGNNFIF